MKHAVLSAFAIAAALSGCAPAPEEPLAGSESVAREPEAVAITAAVANVEEALAPAGPSFNTSNTVHDIMSALIIPNSGRLWNAVSYVVTADGVTETMPETDEDWAQLRASAIALVEGANALMVPGREVDSPARGATYPAYQFTPDEIAQLLNENSQPWLQALEQLQQSTLRTLQAIELRDIGGLTNWGAEINQACESCHSQYWYRPPASQVLP